MISAGFNCGHKRKRVEKESEKTHQPSFQPSASNTRVRFSLAAAVHPRSDARRKRWAFRSVSLSIKVIVVLEITRDVTGMRQKSATHFEGVAKDEGPELLISKGEWDEI